MFNDLAGSDEYAKPGAINVFVTNLEEQFYQASSVCVCAFQMSIIYISFVSKQ